MTWSYRHSLLLITWALINRAGHHSGSYKRLTDGHILSYVCSLTATALDKAGYVYVSDIHSAFSGLWEG